MEKYKLFEALNWASSYLEEHQREAHEGELLLRHITGLSRNNFYMQMRESLPDEQFAAFKKAVEQHIEGVPVQHIIGYEEFYGRRFDVNQDVLIPRPETEELIWHMLEKTDRIFAHKKNVRAADVGTGSGILAITMKLERPDWSVTATDLSAAALKTANRNAETLSADIVFKEGDLLQPLEGESFDVFLSNPPYIPYSDIETMSEIVTDHEPHSALFADEEGLILYRKMSEQLPDHMNRPGLIGFEVGAGQSQIVAAILKKSFPNDHIEVIHDINGKDRMVFCELLK
ncbi:N5-glutamine S-adenosyl-L-methionine-dependent methyltransferase [Jeotgalibacillus alimentarius]|uniref:Release factor glutamine methyltransferase n=1 Tax=Jeotgalibacillus alimentarius TaxID=135826 RepID=A0A0C2V4T6_9BACL|nr:peptide chain release factor N(5)-glutamine methyltransferase [Jeotgalibacillus alimentarius]KIL44002.1 N5-glutamine S-adenosyl-L-methionine-dependent methyltransferase [Jeotgalibacillus alimentarius]